MLNLIFKGIFDAQNMNAVELRHFLLCMAVALVLGTFLAVTYAWANPCTSSFLVTLAILPPAFCVVIMMVNGNVGTGIAVAGAFNMVRFRSAPGTAREIGTVFLAMGAGLLCGTGYLGYAALFTIFLGLSMPLLEKGLRGCLRKKSAEKTMHITIPENLNYSTVFQDLFEEYTTRCETVSVKTTNMGSLFRLTYHLTLKDAAKEKEFIDKLRCRNGNLEITIAGQEVCNYEL